MTRTLARLGGAFFHRLPLVAALVSCPGFSGNAHADIHLVKALDRPALAELDFTPDQSPANGAVDVDYANAPTTSLVLPLRIPEFIDPASVTRSSIFVQLHLNTDPKRNLKLAIYDQTRKRWATLRKLTTRQSQYWQWFAISLRRPIARYMDSNRQVALRLTAGRAEVAVDYLALALNDGVVPTHWVPTVGQKWQVQLSGVVDRSVNADIFDVDLFDVSARDMAELHAQGKSVVCYFSAGSYEDWRPDAGRFPLLTKGLPLDGWPGERWLDVRRLRSLAPVMTARLDLALAKGCDGVDPDNVDGYTNVTGRSLTAAQQLNYNRWLAEEAHQRGLAVGLKNDLDQIPQLVPWFDWALNEQCFVYDECNTLLPFIDAGKVALNIEYDHERSRTDFLDNLCPNASSLGLHSLWKNLMLGPEWLACP